MNPNAAHWRPAAAYLYVLHLDGPSLAWEYLRRNPVYRRDWRQRHRKQSPPHHWCLRHFENPECDARCAQPVWLAEIDSAIPLHIDDDPPQDAPRFCLWDIPGYKTLTQDGDQLRLSGHHAGRFGQMTIARNLGDGMPYTYAVRAGKLAGIHWRIIEKQLALAAASATAHARPTRTALGHMHALQALDGVLAGASQREVAEALFGGAALTDRWHTDGDLRARVRRLIRAGKTLMNGGYRRLLQFDASV